MSLGEISGDLGSDQLTSMGVGSAWLRVRVREDSDSAIALSLTAKLTSPAAVDFDVILYLNKDSDEVECSTTVGTTNTNGTVSSVRTVWGDGIIANGSPDDRYVTIEVRHVSGTCAAAQMWQLEITGNT